MTEPVLNSSPERISFEERVDILARELELAIRWQMPSILFAVYSSEYVRADAEAMLENCLIDLGQQIVHIQARSVGSQSLFQALEEHLPYENQVFFVEDLGGDHLEDAHIFDPLNTRREFFSERRIRIVLWLTQKEIARLARQAPDFWAHRHCVVEFVESPKVEQVLAQEIEAAWQGIGDYADQYEDTDEKIRLRESFLTNIPQHEEASSIRADLLLRLGILNWRRGDFEKANEELTKALKIAVSLQDNWFEAECFNAIALLRASMGKSEEAIEAYKKAIHLAPGQIFAWNNLGNLCLMIGRNDEALVTFLKAIECNPQDPIAWNGLGNVYQKIGYVDDAITAYRNSIQFMPSFAYPWNGLGDTYAGVGRVEDAIKAYQRAAQLNNLYITPWLRLGNLFTKQERYRDALKAFHHAASLDRRNSATWNEIGQVYSKLKEFNEAEDAFSKAIDIDRGNGWAYNNLGMAYFHQEKYEQSIPLFMRAAELLKENRDKAISWNWLGDVYRQLANYDKAIAAYETADKLRQGDGATTSAKLPGETSSAAPIGSEKPAADVPMQESSLAGANPESESRSAEEVIVEEEPVSSVEPKEWDAPIWLSNLIPGANGPEAMTVVTNKASGKSEATVISGAIPQIGADMDDAFKSHFDAAVEWNEKGNMYFKRGDYENAIAAYNKAIQLDPALGWAYCNLALIYDMQNQSAEAILLYQKSIDLLTSDKDRAICWNGLGNVYRRLGDYENALAAYQNAAALDPETAGMREGMVGSQGGDQAPKSAKAWNDLGEAFIKSGAYKDAEAAFKKAIEVNRNFGMAYGNLALALSSQGKYAEAIPLFEKGIDMVSNDKDKATLLNRLGNAYRKLNDYDNAIKSFREAIAVSDESVNLVTRARFSLLSNCGVS